MRRDCLFNSAPAYVISEMKGRSFPEMVPVVYNRKNAISPLGCLGTVITLGHAIMQSRRTFP